MPTGQPNYLTVNPDGTTGANFAGHISAQGLDLPAAIQDTPQPVNVVQWLRQNPADSKRVGDLYSYNDLGLQEAALCAAVQAPDTPARLVELDLFAELTTASTGISVSAQDEGHPQPRKTLLTSAGVSDWVMDSDTPPAASDLQSTYGAGLTLKPGVVANNLNPYFTRSGISAGPTYTSTGSIIGNWTSVTSPSGFVIVGLNGWIQHNGTNGTTYTHEFGIYVDGALNEYLGIHSSSVNGTWQTMCYCGGVAVTAGIAHAMQIKVILGTASTWGMYDYSAWLIAL